MCGAGTLRVLRAIVLPLTLPAIVATAIYVFMHAIRDLSTAILLSGANNSIVSVVILDLWNNGEVPQLAALSTVISAGMTTLAVVFMRLSTRHNYRDMRSDVATHERSDMRDHPPHVTPLLARVGYSRIYWCEWCASIQFSCTWPVEAPSTRSHCAWLLRFTHVA